MSQYKIENITNVFWACNDGFKAGRDPMGIQNSSIATYSCLLPGLTNLTGHIRYYSIYCWLIREYLALHEANKNFMHQYNFIRRAELIIAYIMKGRGVNAVVGANFVANDSNTDGAYDIASGADYRKEDGGIYWSYLSGAFGQYYLGSLLYFNLVTVVDKGFKLGSEGEKLAEDFTSSVDIKVRDLFIACIIKGHLNDNEIELLRPMGVDAIVPHSNEWHALNRMLVSEDSSYSGQSSLRRDTIYLMLTDLRKGQTVGTFVEHRFKSYEKGVNHEASFGWYFYYLCETLHICIESILCLVLSNIEEMHSKDMIYPQVGDLVEKSCQGVMAHLSDAQGHSYVSQWMPYCRGDITEMRSELKDAIKNDKISRAVAVAVPLMLRLQNEYEANKVDVDSFVVRHNLQAQRGILNKCLNDYVTRFLNLSPKSYIERLLCQVMNEHTCVAISKMGSSNLDLRKFILDDGRAVLVEIRYPVETNPRISSLYSFLVDLGYIDAETYVADDFLKGYGL